MAKPLWQDTRYIRDIEWAIEMLDKWVEANPTNKHKGKALRMKYALLAQPDKAFQPIIQRAIDTGQDMQAFVKSLKGVEDGLIRKSKPFSPPGIDVYRGIKGGIMEGHHGMATSTLSRLDRILKQRGGIARALRIVGIARSKGATPGTLGKHLYMMGQSTHRSGATIPDDQLSAHENPVKTRINPKTGAVDPSRRVINTKFFGQDTSFDPALDDFVIGEALYDDFLGQKLITEAAYNRPSEKATRAFINKLLGTNAYKLKVDSPKFKLAQKLLNTLPFGHDHLVKGYDTGLGDPDLPKDYIKMIRSAFKEGSGDKNTINFLTDVGKNHIKSTDGIDLYSGLPLKEGWEAFKRGGWKWAAGGGVFDPSVHENLAKKQFKGAGKEFVKGSVIGLATDALLPTAAKTVLGTATPAIGYGAVRGIVNPYVKEATGKNLEQHAMEIPAGPQSYASSHIGGSGPNTIYAAQAFTNWLKEFDIFKKPWITF